MRSIGLIALLAGLLAVLAVSPSFCQNSGLQEITAETDCFSCHSSKEIAKECPDVSVTIDQKKWQHSKHNSLGCSACHGEKPHPNPTDTNTAEKWDQFKSGLNMSCMGCHPDIQQSFSQSIHATSSNKHAPGSCAGCHNPHEPGPSAKSKMDMVKQCSGCHSEATKSYQASVHGQNLALGNEKSATCLDCHDYHGVKSVKSVTSSDLVRVCSRCHKGVTNKAVTGWFSHTPSTPVQHWMLRLSAMFYLLVIPFTLVSMVTHQFLRHRRTLERHRAKRRGNR